MAEIRRQIAILGRLPGPVLVTGPTGSGKGVAARLLHAASLRPGPFVPGAVTALPAGLELAALVGHARGAFTGADRETPGLVEAAHGGSLFLDEIAHASPPVRQALLTLLEDHVVRRVGETRFRRVDVRFVAATNADLAGQVERGTFPDDLYFRLTRFEIRLPALREHAEDLPELVEALHGRIAREMGAPCPPLTPEETDRLRAYVWPGNVRELENVLWRRVATGALPDGVGPSGPWRHRMTATLEECNGNITRAARRLGVSRKTLSNELHRPVKSSPP